MPKPTDNLAERDWAHWTEPAFVDIEGVNTAYRRKGSGEPLLFLHGAGMTRTWLPLFEELSKSFDVIVPEHPGYGDTELPSWVENMDDFVLHYDALLRELDIENPHLVGHSLGGWMAANQAIFYPTRFRSLTLLAPMGLMVPEAPLADPFRLSPQTGLEMLFSGVGEHYLEYLQQGDPVENQLHSYEESITLALLAWNPRYDYRLNHRLGRVHIPATVVAFADDRFVPRRHAELYAEYLPQGHLEILEGVRGEPASHVAIVQQPVELAALIAKATHR
ncbi:MAG TPA: alpha/beta hydrolase [Pseudolysinimonas sp.]|nr:alpha/beta hydrolase [Pseudolysinimonas sp.]